ncbi:MAG: hypothetical protein ISS28_07740 [Candidatus Cloacimonetes bacterium]|nr:hypothetical protein [Candidatus Cloacimonadota bacterium]
MRYLKIVLSIITVLFSITNLFGLYSDGFIIGCYSYLNDNSVTNSDSVYFRFISEAHFNCHLCNSDNNSPDITNLITESDSRGLDMILTDRVWQPENDIIGVYNLLRANYWKYEAEYSGIGEEIEPEPCHSEFYYRIIRGDNVGEFDFDDNASHDYMWQCLENYHSSGLAADTLYWKWQYNNKDELLENQIILPIQDTLFFDFAMRLEPLGHSNSTPICDVNVFVVNDDGEKVYLPIHTYVRLPYNNELSVGEFVGMGATGDVYVDFSFYTIVDSILEELINAYGGFEPQLKNFNFEVYWHGNGNLYIDYFKIYDDIYRKLKNGEYNDMLANRLTQIGLTPSSNSSLKYLYAKDEPRPPQFDAHRIVEDSLLWQYSNLLLPALDKYHGCYPDYHHHEFFNDYAEPEQVMLDSYPIKSGLKWNVPTGDKNIQGHINWMLNIYENAIEEFSEKPLMAIPQSYGRWDYANTDSARWGWTMRPPKEMQKCLQYLPLCYDMDGVVDFKLISAYN